MFETVQVEPIGLHTRVILNRPLALNAFNLQMRDELAQVFAVLAADADCRVVVLSGAGRGFCAGADLTEFAAGTPLYLARQVRRLRDVFLALRTLPQVTIAALHGHVIGSGLELALECDLRIAADGTLFRLPETYLGFIPAAGATQTLARTIGRAGVLDMVLRGEPLSTAAAMRRGLVSRVLPLEGLQLAATALAEQISSYPAAASARLALRAADTDSSPTGFALEQALAEQHLAATPHPPRLEAWLASPG